MYSPKILQITGILVWFFKNMPEIIPESVCRHRGEQPDFGSCVKLSKCNRMMYPDIASWRNTIYSHMLRTRGSKYRWFLRHMKMFRLIAKEPQRAEFLETYYTLMRYIDDIVDNDAPLPPGYANAESYLLEKMWFARHPENPSDDVDALMQYCFRLGESFGESFSEETEAILGSLLFDARRMGKREVFPHAALMAHYHRLDIFGTIRATVKLFNEDPKKYVLLEPLGMACRFHYDLRDFSDDVRKGLINISLEDTAAFGIEQRHLDDPTSLPVRRWFRAQALRGMALLEQHKRIVGTSGFRFTTRLTFPLVYAGPARRFLKNVLRETADLADVSMPAESVRPPVYESI